MVDSLKRLARHLPAVLGLALLVGAVYVVQREFRHLQLKDIGHALEAIPHAALAFAFAWTILSYFILTFYDRLGTIYAGHKVSYGRVAFASFCAYALSHNLGFAAVSGAAVRYRLYAHWGLTPLQIGKTVAFCSLTFGLGGMVLGGAILFVEPGSVPFFGQHLPRAALYGVGALLWVIVLGYVTLSRILGTFRVFGHAIELPGWRMAIVQVLLATIDVATTATIFYALLPPAHGLHWLVFLGIYLSCYSAGLAANLPGGIGVFDTAMLFGLEPYFSAPHIVGAILVFRLYYYVIPLFLAGSLFAGNEILLRGGGILRHVGRLPAIQAMGRWSEPDFAVTATTGAVGLCGVLMLGLGVLTPQSDFSWIDPDYGDLASQAGQFVPSLIGAGLVLMAIGLSHRVNLAWTLTILLLVAGAAFAATQANRLWVVGILALTTLLLAPFRACFYRHPRLLAGPFDPSSAMSLIVLVVCLLALAVTRPHTHALHNNAFWAVILSREVPNSVRLAVGIAVLLGLTAMWLLLRPSRVSFIPWDQEALRMLRNLGAQPDTAATAGAEGVVMGEAEKAALPFRRCGRVLLGLGDPSGEESDRVSAIWRLRDLARQEGLDAAVWRAGPDLLKIYGDLGLTALPLDEDGLPAAESQGDTLPARHYLVCQAERDLNLLLPILPKLVKDRAVTPVSV
ncbi:MAG TPA: phosphatidylglycerol lysyltransferase domain-containing protein [Rhodopila sp.]|uniref:phosphatidylglycerol lysyltransferase domain-containing protein n=1 Tax=Rhodopila sp. TaxID=2480087 RepID=UPI002CB9BDE1|nr:phosphatidylglycerol lysyltransferase domain-containing protein [Rhodopila sp.]HVY15809.1 phosphatidylglycerol lysyltransferase domain-containing protein [Rhodopila sp.]